MSISLSFIAMISLLDLCLLFQHSIDVDLFLGVGKYTIGNTPNHKVKQINIKVNILRLNSIKPMRGNSKTNPVTNSHT